MRFGALAALLLGLTAVVLRLASLGGWVGVGGAILTGAVPVLVGLGDGAGGPTDRT